jgi:uncharacterized lipoprotein YajG
MKKLMFVFAAALMFAACSNGGSNEQVNVDSVAVADSSVVAVDSTVAQIPADSTK